MAGTPAKCGADTDFCNPEDGLCVENSWPDHSEAVKKSCVRVFANQGLVCCSIVGKTLKHVQESKFLFVPSYILSLSIRITALSH